MMSDGTARAGMHAGYASQFSGGVATIAPASALPSITEAVVIDGTTQPGWSSTPIIELNGTSAGAAVDGLTFTASGSTLRGLAINRFLGSGVVLSGAGATGNWIVGNRIGTDPGGTLDRGNGQDGVRVASSAATNTIGGSVPAHANLIAYNDGNGVTVASGAGESNQIVLNSIHSNGALGIDLAGSGVTANDGTTTLGQPNQLIDHPVFTSAVLAGSSLTVAGYVGTAPGQTAFSNSRIEIFESDGDGSGFGEGQTYLGFLTSSGSSGDFSGSLTVSGVAAGDRITATATGGANTSEFGAQQPVDVVALVKRAYLADGTPIVNLATVPKGTLVKFVLYLNNQGPLVSDVSVQDVLDPGFQYVAGSMRVSNTPAACALPACTGAEEAAIFTAANSGTAVTDAVDGDAASYAATTLNVGNQSAANAQLDLAAARVWAVVFSVRTQ
jgi:uncharacterized repeat protein (TIGR01451 family)